MDFLLYVNADEWTNFGLHLSERTLDTFVCSCPTSHFFPATVIVEVPRHNLLIYVTHGGDGAHVENSFKAQLAELKVTTRRPYTFVHGWRGLEVMLAVLGGHDPDGLRPIRSPLRNTTWAAFPHQNWQESDDERPSNPSALQDFQDQQRTDLELMRSALGTDRIELHLTNGYACGDLFFYDPKHLAVDPTVNVLLEFADSTTEPQSAARLAAVLDEFTDFMGPIHPQVALALGTLYLRSGEYDRAEQSLQQAADLEHRWLAATRTYLDSTPKRRPEPGSSDVAAPWSAQQPVGDVTANKHTVSRLTPAVNDHGLWDFPAMAEACIPEVYSFKHALAGQGLAQGRLHRAALDEKWLELPGSGDLATLTMKNIMLINYLAGQDHLALHVLFFWEGYVLGRWDLALGPFASQATFDRGLGRANAPDVVAIIDELRADPPRMKWFDRGMHRYYLDRAFHTIRLRLFHPG